MPYRSNKTEIISSSDTVGRSEAVVTLVMSNNSKTKQSAKQVGTLDLRLKQLSSSLPNALDKNQTSRTSYAQLYAQ